MIDFLKFIQEYKDSPEIERTNGCIIDGMKENPFIVKRNMIRTIERCIENYRKTL